MSLKKIIFFKVKTNSEKLKKIVEVATFYQEKSLPLTILVPDEKAQAFIDELLWKLPETSFLPHSTDNTENIQIRVFSKGANYQKHIFNLCSFDLPIDPYLTIYELEDQTSKVKLESFRNKIKIYQDKKIPIESK